MAQRQEKNKVSVLAKNTEFDPEVHNVDYFHFNHNSAYDFMKCIIIITFSLFVFN